MPHYQIQKALKVSIHAPVKGATILITLVPSLSACFNSRSREGSDSGQFRTINVTDVFQFTLP